MSLIEQIAELALKMYSTKQHAEVKVRTTCRSCESDRLQSVLDLENLYVSNFADVPDSGRWPRVPLDLLLCGNCGLAQLRHTTPPEWLYTHYWYKSGISAMMRVALTDIARKAAHFVGLHAGDSVLDIGCNDGTLLRSYDYDDVRRVGFEPAENLACEAAAGTDRIVPDFFSARVRLIGVKLQEWLRDERREGREISAYGASTRGNTLLQVFALDHTMIRSAAERNPEKWGKYTVGTWIPIVSEAEARAHADDFLVLPWHFMDEIQARERDFLARGGKLVAPLPNLRLIAANEWSTIA
jgi:hypothetical protein